MTAVNDVERRRSPLLHAVHMALNENTLMWPSAFARTISNRLLMTPMRIGRWKAYAPFLAELERAFAKGV